MRGFLEIIGIVLGVLFALALVVAIPLLVFAFYGAIFGAFGAGAYATFMWLVGLFGL